MDGLMTGAKDIKGGVEVSARRGLLGTEERGLRVRERPRGTTTGATPFCELKVALAGALKTCIQCLNVSVRRL